MPPTALRQAQLTIRLIILFLGKCVDEPRPFFIPASAIFVRRENLDSNIKILGPRMFSKNV
jgi:hypothetical protein